MACFPKRQKAKENSTCYSFIFFSRQNAFSSSVSMQKNKPTRDSSVVFSFSFVAKKRTEFEIRTHQEEDKDPVDLQLYRMINNAKCTESMLWYQLKGLLGPNGCRSWRKSLCVPVWDRSCELATNALRSTGWSTKGFHLPYIEQSLWPWL